LPPPIAGRKHGEGKKRAEMKERRKEGRKTRNAK
jgi:hypothetical protein